MRYVFLTRACFEVNLNTKQNGFPKQIALFRRLVNRALLGNFWINNNHNAAVTAYIVYDLSKHSKDHKLNRYIPIKSK